jgi:hypothetical protein
MPAVHVRDGCKWRFSDGGERPFTAEMEDAEFQNKVQEGLVALNANDAIRCRLREEHSLSESCLVKIVYVEQGLEHCSAARQMNLLSAGSMSRGQINTTSHMERSTNCMDHCTVLTRPHAHEYGVRCGTCLFPVVFAISCIGS